MTEEYYVCEFCSNGFGSEEERELCRVNCHLDAIYHMYDEYEGDNFWTIMSMMSYFHLTVEDIEKFKNESKESYGSGGMYL